MYIAVHLRSNKKCLSVLESPSWSTDPRRAYRSIWTLRSSRSPPRCFTVKAADGTTLTRSSEIRASWAGYLEEMYRVDPPDLEFHEDVDAVRDAPPL